jgi:hypothetical protein
MRRMLIYFASALAAFFIGFSACSREEVEEGRLEKGSIEKVIPRVQGLKDWRVQVKCLICLYGFKLKLPVASYGESSP